MVDNVQSILRSVTLVAVLVAATVNLYAVENFGELRNGGSFHVQDGSSRLYGSTSDALCGLSALVLAVSVGYVVVLGVAWHRQKRDTGVLFDPRYRRMFWYDLWSLTCLLAVTAGMAEAGLTLYFVENFNQLGAQWSTDPNPPVADQNYKARGPIGKALLGTGIASTTLAALGLVVQIWAWNASVPATYPFPRWPTPD